MARGGKRSGAPGAQYSNRSDLQQGPRLAPTAQTNQPYGVAGQQLQSQSVIPLSAPPTPQPAAPQSSALPPPIPLNSPTGRPNEPIQSGLSSGPGAGPSTAPNSVDPVEAQLRGLYMQYPNRDLASLLEMLDKGQTF